MSFELLGCTALQEALRWTKSTASRFSCVHTYTDITVILLPLGQSYSSLALDTSPPLFFVLWSASHRLRRLSACTLR